MAISVVERVNSGSRKSLLRRDDSLIYISQKNSLFANEAAQLRRPLQFTKYMPQDQHPRAELRLTLSTNPFQCDSSSWDYALS